MLYRAYDAQSDLMSPMRAAASIGQFWFDGLARFTRGTVAERIYRPVSAGFEMLSRAALSHERPAFGIHEVTVGHDTMAVREDVVATTPFASLLRFTRESDVELPRILVVVPLSGHFATLLRATIVTMLQDHDVYVTDWHNARDVPAADGGFGPVVARRDRGESA